MNYTHLRAFWAVAHEGSLTRAAGRLNVAQSALSTQIQALEQRMGQALFERRGRGLHLTEAGRIALDHADVIFATAEELTATLASQSGPRQILRVGALATLSRNFQLEFLAPILGKPGVEVVLRSGGMADLLAALEAHRLDVVLLTTVPPRDAATPWVVHPIDTQSVSLVGTPERIGEAKTLAALLDQPLILPSVESGIRMGFDRLVDQHKLRPNVVAEADDMAMLRLLARQDIGIALVPPIVVQDELKSGKLVEALALDGVQEAFSAVTLSRRFPNTLLQDVLPSAAK
ncbi:LysR family transcriptional activator of nhaA [Rubricella aquisinus]|uniref:LysR family transcriptional activator of nhaA n=1 Tax=Rubricella aquisinus TaxID=2028108 RepID=A0A840WVC1_9RHOB|nr:LysR family transcriptional regulator [Rubricella aquisinus]MBB5514184.1 LysR family transcriptional activator of nhaA [Rubricella aquisinus]